MSILTVKYSNVLTAYSFEIKAVKRCLTKHAGLVTVHTAYLLD